MYVISPGLQAYSIKHPPVSLYVINLAHYHLVSYLNLLHLVLSSVEVYVLTTNTPLGAAPASLLGIRSHTDW